MRIISILFVLLFSATVWAGEVNFTGDVRLRHEIIDDATTTTQVTRQRVRARVNAEAVVSEDTVVGIGLATGDANRRSTNQTLGGTFSSKGINLDTAYIGTKVLGADVLLGKFKNPLVTQSELFWDSDVRPEGVVVSYDLKDFTLSGAYLVTEDNATDDEALALGQISFSNELLEVSASYTASVNAAVNARYIGVNGMWVKPILGLQPFGEYVINHEATTDDTAWLVGVKTSYKKLDISYAYREVEANSVNALLTDSYFGNGTDVKGSELNLTYAFNNLKLEATYFDAINGLTNGTDYDRFQFDLLVNF
jgi:hypothetical protein